MTKQNFISMSLGSGLKFYIKSDLCQYPELVGIRKDYLEFNYHGVYLSFKKDFIENPILHPLSDITKEIEHNGEKFVPIEKLGYNINYCLDIKFNSLTVDDFIRLIEWHFDIAGLIENGEAIDINTIENPYK